MCNLPAMGGEGAFLNHITENGSIKPHHENNYMNEMTRINS